MLEPVDNNNGAAPVFRPARVVAGPELDAIFDRLNNDPLELPPPMPRQFFRFAIAERDQQIIAAAVRNNGDRAPVRNNRARRPLFERLMRGMDRFHDGAIRIFRRMFGLQRHI